MPCTYTGSIEGDVILQHTEALDQMERMLCAICSQMEENIGEPFTATILKNAQARMEPDDRNLLLWWKGHKLIDSQRKGE